MERVGVIGLGRMGQEIARRVAAQGTATTGWTRSGVSAEMAADLWIAVASDLDELVRQSDVLILSLFDDDAVAEVLETLMASSLEGRLIIDTSTVSPTLLHRYSAQLSAGGAAAVDAPISGGPEMVANGTCGVFVGGAKADFDRAERVLALFSGQVIHTGDLGTGMGMKIVNNSMIAGLFATLSEIIQIAKRSGLDYETTLRVVAGGPGGPPFLQSRLDRALGHDESVGFPISGVNKDLTVFRAAADELGVEAPVLGRAAEVAGMARDAGLNDHDAAALIRAAWDRA